MKEVEVMQSNHREYTMPQAFEYYRPRTLAEAIALLSRPNFHTTPLIVQPKAEALRQVGIDAFVDLSLLGLDKIEENQDGSVHIGAMVTLQEMVDSPILKDGTRQLLSRAAELSAGPGIRNLAGLWGTIQARNGPPEILLSLLDLEAELTLLGAGEKQRKISFQDFHALGKDSLPTGELILEARLPPLKACCGWALERVARTPRDEAIVAAAAIVEVEDGKVSRVRLAVAGAHPQPIRLPQIEEMLRGSKFTPNILQEAAGMISQQADPVGDFRGSSEYREAMAGLVAQRALKRAWGQTASQPGGKRK
jgi:CO/xanthine dehydrogenase FAD-binding subunit